MILINFSFNLVSDQSLEQYIVLDPMAVSWALLKIDSIRPSKRKPSCERIDERCPRRHVAEVSPMLGRMSTD